MNAIMKDGHHNWRPGTKIIIYHECLERWAKEYWETDHGIIAKTFVKIIDDKQHYKNCQMNLF